MYKNLQICFIVCVYGAFSACVSGESETSETFGGDILNLPAGVESTVTLRQQPMPNLGDGRVARILTRYFQEGLGGADNWESISSLRLAGVIKLKDGEFDLNALQKKPDLLKLTLRGDQRSLILAYDGKVAWQHLPYRGEKPKVMPEAEARRFIHSAHFGNHLLYPYATGKTIQYIDTVPVEGAICHQIRVSLETGYQVDYFIDIRSYLEVKVVNKDLLGGATNSIVYKDYIREFGIPIAKQVESYEEGEWVSSLRLHEVKVNSGVVPWMFKMR